jgi:hypothetical protein
MNSTNKFPNISDLIKSVTDLGGQLKNIQDRHCLFAPDGFIFNIINSPCGQLVIYSGAGLYLDQESIMIPAGTLLSTNNGISSFAPNIIRPFNVGNIMIDLVPY